MTTTEIVRDCRRLHRALAATPRVGFDGLHLLPDGPGLYTLHLVDDASGLYRSAVEADTVLYVGSTTASLRGRLASYRDRIAAAEGIALDAVAIGHVALHAARARYAEHLLLVDLRPCWTAHGPLPGLAGNRPGRHRTPWCPPWHVLHPGWPPTADLPRRHTADDLRTAVRHHLEEMS